MAKTRFKIIKAKHAGFCFGVKRAIAIAENFLAKNKKAFSLGPIIHNPIVVSALSKKGLTVIDDIKKAKGRAVVIRSHGVSPRIIKKAKALSVCLIDATCPFVKRSHDIVSRLKKDGYLIVIIGEKSHPEIKALHELAGRDAVIALRKGDLDPRRLKGRKVASICQTTLGRQDFLDISNLLIKSGCYECCIFDTICNDVSMRQQEAKNLAKTSDIVVVVGGKISANTRHLANIARREGAMTCQIETEKDVKPFLFKSASSVAVISGASTPIEIVDKVVKKIKMYR